MEVTVLGSFAEGGRGVWCVVCDLWVWVPLDARAEKTGCPLLVLWQGTVLTVY